MTRTEADNRKLRVKRKCKIFRVALIAASFLSMFLENRRDPRASRYENLVKIKDRRLELEDDRRKG